MNRIIKVYYIIKNITEEKIVSMEASIETKFLGIIHHKNNDYYIGFSGFSEQNEAVQTIVDYNFYYFYNMVEGIMKITNFIKFESEMNAEELLNFEMNRIKKLQERKMLIITELKKRLKKYERYKQEIDSWIKCRGSSQLKNLLANREDVELSYLIERVDWESKKDNFKTKYNYVP